MTPTRVGALTIWRFGHLAGCTRLTHGVTTRIGGVSAPPYDSLNLGLHVGDDREAVIENRRRVCDALGADFGHYTVAAQVHGANLAVVTPAQVGAGRLDPAEAIPNADGLVVTRPGVLVSVLSVVCVPLICYDPAHHLGAVVHAGWRGTAAGVARRAVQLLQQACGSRPSDLLIGMGPGIGPCCYRVSEAVARRIAESAGVGTAVLRKSDCWYADLAAANRQQLLAAGVPAERIEDCGLCTSCHSEEFFSERKLGRPTGRFSTFLCLE